ncbi:MAG: DNA-binding transcriptional LysR family regulator, partial [Thermoproteota archaeon]
VFRSPQSVLLTKKGLDLYQRASLFHRSNIKEFHPTEDSKVLRIGCLQGVAQNWLQGKLKEYSSNFEIEIANPQDLKRMLEENKVDLIFNNKNIQSKHLTSIKLFKEKIVLISKDQIKFSDLSNSPWILSNKNDYLINYAKKKKINISKSLNQASNINVVISMVENGMGIGMVPLHTLDDKSVLYKLKTSVFDEEYLYLTTHDYQIIPTHINKFLTLCRK